MSIPTPAAGNGDSGERAFALAGELPRGVTVLEASAGTGKTYTIAALATRFVADGMPLSRLLLVTFTRMATGELRERVRERFVAAELALGRVLAGADPTGLDEVTVALAAGDAETVEQRRARLANAISDFDAATIATTHSFCQEVLGELGTLGDLEPGVRLEENIDDLIEQVVDDLYVRAFIKVPNPPFARAEAVRIARMAIDHPTATIHPVAPELGTVPARRAALAQRARSTLEGRKRALGVISYDDLLVRLAETLRGPHGERATERLRSRYGVVLIDEFQDTDPVQWEIVSRAFDAAGVTLVLVGDPKQAIYAFRGADVGAYLEAARSARERATLRVNRRSDQRLLDAFDALFDGAQLGHPEIVYRTVSATPAHMEPRLRGAPGDAALRIRVVDRAQVELTNYGYAAAPSTRDHIASDLAADVVALLASGATITSGGEGAVTARKVLPRDIAVLVQTNNSAKLIQGRLSEAGVPAVLAGAGSVLGTPAAEEWLRLLSALERPASPTAARSAALTPFLGWDVARLADAGEEQLEGLHQQLHTWARLLRERGIAALAQTIVADERLPARVLRTRGGERRLTDLEHVGQVLHAAATADTLGLTALTGWLRQRIAAADDESGREELARRLESDADAVQVLTIHRSKGLEFPIVYCPSLWEPGRIPDTGDPVFFHDEQTGARGIDVGLEGVDYEQHRNQAAAEDRGEELRLAYVALTRARHQTVVWWAGSAFSRESPLSRIAFERAPGGAIARSAGRVPSDAVAVERFMAIAARAPSAIAVEYSRLTTPTGWSVPRRPETELTVAAFSRHLDLRWRRTSYSDITATAHDAFGSAGERVGSEPEEPLSSDEPVIERAAPVPIAGSGNGDPAALREISLPLAELPFGARVGTYVHRILAAAAFDAADLGAELDAVIDSLRPPAGVRFDEHRTLARGLEAAIRTPLEAQPGSWTLSDLARCDRLDELGFELPLVGGEDPTGTVTLRAIASLLRRSLPSDDLLAGYAERLEDPLLRGEVRGYLTGSIDLVARLRSGGRVRYAVVDYKSNRLAAPEEPLTAWNYRPAALAAEMQRSHYALQALLYMVALHRYLRWRAPGYDPDRDLAGARYLFLRGMVGESAPALDGTRLGVFSWTPPSGLIQALSALLDGRIEAS